jgi:hypothetical protein
VNFHPSAYALNSSNAFVQVATWSIESGLVACEGDSSIKPACKSFLYNTKDNKPAQDTPPDVIVDMPDYDRGILISLATVITINVGVYFVIVTYFINSKLIKASQPFMLYLMLVGEVIGSGKIAFVAADITTDTCIGGLWTGHLGYALVFGSLFLKTWRVNRIINNASLKRVKISSWDMILYSAIMIVAIVVYMIIFTVVGKPHESAIVTRIRNQTTYYTRCAYEYDQFHLALFIAEGVLLVMGARLCWAVKDVPDAVNESKYIAMGERMKL